MGNFACIEIHVLSIIGYYVLFCGGKGWIIGGRFVRGIFLR